jgi:hypothetical protein
VFEWKIQPESFWEMTVQEFWLLLDFHKSKGNPKTKIKPLTKSRLREMIAADEERQRKKAQHGNDR